jgi:prepilin-type N-terminal cleavage/methylation domain-containing protein
MNRTRFIKLAVLNGEMTMKRDPARGNRAEALHQAAAGYTLVEVVVAVAIVLILAGMSVPLIQSALTTYQRNSAVTTVTGPIHAARYNAIFTGKVYRLAFSKADSTYQLANSPAAPPLVFTDVGSAVPFTGTLAADTTLEFHPGGWLRATAGTTTLSLTYKDTTENITVTSYGNITVTP